MICRDQVPKKLRRCSAVHALPRFYSTLGSCCFCLLTDFSIGVFRISSELIVVFSWLAIDETFLTLGIFFQSTSHRIGDNRKKLLNKKNFFDNSCLGSLVAVGVEEDEYRSSNLL